MAIQIQMRRATAASWTSVNPILASGEPGYETDTGKIKYGDGITAWTSLAYRGGTTDASALTTGTLSTARLPALTGGDVTSSVGSGTLTLTNSGITASTYKSVTVDAKGRVTAGSNPTTLSGYGITDAQATLVSGTNIKTINGNSILGSGDIVTSPTWQSVQTANFTATSNLAYPVNTTAGAVTITLPANPTINDTIVILDYAGTFSTNSVGLNPNGKKLNGSTSTTYLAINRECVELVYLDVTQGWIPFNGFNTATPSLPYAISYLQVAGGGAGGTAEGGGGGGGGVIASSLNAYAGQVLTITVGAGGVGSNVVGTQTSGSPSSITTTTASVGGGYGSSGAGGANGGSGGGASGYASTTSKGLGTSGQGFNGGLGSVNPNYGGGGGGGAGAVGADGTTSAGGAGGAGISSSITGSAIYYAGGGGGSIYTAGSAGTGGNGGGGAGSNSSADATSGTVNTGGGGGGGWNAGATMYRSGNGGSGVVILSIPTANYSGKTTGSPTVTANGSNTILKFTVSGSYTA